MCLKYCLEQVSWNCQGEVAPVESYDSTLEKSAVGDMTKLSALADQDIRCWMVVSSSMLAWS